ncbi:MAG: hypothetical protein P1P84_24845 [Deferrisomatales bacterium]|nr:hypothetical protein [Deferrisomatales bacterium]
MTSGEAVQRKQPAGGPEEDPYRPLRTGRRIFVGALSLFCVAYYPILQLVASSLIPLVALVLVGGAAGFVGRRKTVILYAVLAWLVLAAVIVRRAATARFSPELILFDGALAGYPLWSVWFAEVVRVGANLWSLWLGARLGRWARGGVDRRVRGLWAWGLRR